MDMYHGTNKECAEKILKEGFREYTYFTPYLATALSYGGAYIFKINDNNVTDKHLGEGRWEWIYKDKIPPEKIIALIHYKEVELLYYNPETSYNERKKENTCEFCKGRGETSYVDDGHGMLPGGGSFKNDRKIIVCEVCHGHGIIEKQED